MYTLKEICKKTYKKVLIHIKTLRKGFTVHNKVLTRKSLTKKSIES